MIESVSPTAVTGAIAEACPGIQVTGVQPIELGYSSHNFLIDSDEGRLLAKIPKRQPDPERLDGLVAATGLAAKAGLPVPEHRWFLRNCEQLSGLPLLVQQYLPGAAASAEWPELDLAHRETVARELGEAVARLHGITGQGFTDVLGGNASPSWGAYVHDRVEESVKVLSGSVDFAPGWETVRAAMTEAVDALPEPVTPVLVHLDLYLDNVLVHNGHLRCVLDFEHARFGDSYADFGKLDELVFGWYPETEEPFMEAYRAVHPAAGDTELRMRVGIGLHNLASCAYFSQWTPRLVPEYLARIDDWLQSA
jgi:aminoglycoside phosphotransferase (APT) family kinase protein